MVGVLLVGVLVGVLLLLFFMGVLPLLLLLLLSPLPRRHPRKCPPILCLQQLHHQAGHTHHARPSGMVQ